MKNAEIVKTVINPLTGVGLKLTLHGAIMLVPYQALNIKYNNKVYICPLKTVQCTCFISSFVVLSALIGVCAPKLSVSVNK